MVRQSISLLDNAGELWKGRVDPDPETQTISNENWTYLIYEEATMEAAGNAVTRVFFLISELILTEIDKQVLIK